jgi:hypothetical protein
MVEAHILVIGLCAKASCIASTFAIAHVLCIFPAPHCASCQTVSLEQTSSAWNAYEEQKNQFDLRFDEA